MAYTGAIAPRLESEFTGRQFRSLVHPDLRQLRWMSGRQAAQSVIRFFPRLKNCSLGRFDILRRAAVGVAAPIESGIAINAAERADSDCAQEIPLHGPRR